MMMMAPAAFRRHRQRWGESPLFFFLLDLLPRWEKSFPSGPWSPWRGRGESPSEIGSVSLSLSVSAFADPSPSPFLLYPEIRNSDRGESFTQIFLIKLSFLRQKKSVNRLMGCHEAQGRDPSPVAPSGTISCWFFFPKIINIPKMISVHFLSCLDSV